MSSNHWRLGSQGVRAGSAAGADVESIAWWMVGVDLEMTGSDIRKDQVIEMACLITAADRSILAEGN